MGRVGVTLLDLSPLGKLVVSRQLLTPLFSLLGDELQRTSTVCRKKFRLFPVFRFRTIPGKSHLISSTFNCSTFLLRLAQWFSHGDSNSAFLLLDSAGARCIRLAPVRVVY